VTLRWFVAARVVTRRHKSEATSSQILFTHTTAQFPGWEWSRTHIPGMSWRRATDRSASCANEEIDSVRETGNPTISARAFAAHFPPRLGQFRWSSLSRTPFGASPRLESQWNCRRSMSPGISKLQPRPQIRANCRAAVSTFGDDLRHKSLTVRTVGADTPPLPRASNSTAWKFPPFIT
jgi:hypothetical protein